MCLYMIKVQELQYEYEPHFPQGFLGGCVTSHFCSEIIMSETLCNERHCQF